MLALVGLIRFLPSPFKGCKRTDLDIQPDRESSLEGRWQSIGSKIQGGVLKFNQQLINKRGIDQRAISRNSNDRPCVNLQSGSVKAIEYIELAAAVTLKSTHLAEIGDGIV